MSTTTTARSQGRPDDEADRADRGADGRPRSRPDGWRPGRPEGDDLQALGEAADPADGPGARPGAPRDRPGRGQRLPAGLRSAPARQRDRPDLRRVPRRPPGRLRRRAHGPDEGARHLRRRLGAGLGSGLLPQRRRPGHRAPDALRRRGQDQLPAAGVLRQAAARRADEPGHQRHRQRQPDAPADDEPAADLAAHRRRGALDDVLDLAAARADRPGLRAADDVRDLADHEALPGAVHRPVAAHRPAQRAHRGDLLRPRAGHGVRSSRGGRARPSPSRTTSCTRPRSRPSSSAA